MWSQKGIVLHNGVIWLASLVATHANNRMSCIMCYGRGKGGPSHLPTTNR